MNNATIVEWMKAGKTEKVFNGLYRYFPSIRKNLIKMGATPDECHDIFQDAILVFYKKYTEESSLIESPLAYINNTCRFIFIKSKRNLVWKESPSELSSEQEDVEAFWLEEEKLSKAQKAFESLGERCKKILLMFYIKKMSMTAISKELGFTSENVAKTQKYKCIEFARNQFKNQ